MPSTEQMPPRVNKLGEDRVEIQDTLGESSVIDLKTAKQRLENLQREKNNFASQEMWQKQINVTKETIALLGGDEGGEEGEEKSAIAKIIGKVKEMLRGKK